MLWSSASSQDAAWSDKAADEGVPLCGHVLCSFCDRVGVCVGSYPKSKLSVCLAAAHPRGAGGGGGGKLCLMFFHHSYYGILRTRA